MPKVFSFGIHLASLYLENLFQQLLYTQIHHRRRNAQHIAGSITRKQEENSYPIQKGDGTGEKQS